MARIDYPEAIRALILQLKRLPGIGPRGAERIALWMLRSRESKTTEIADAIAKAATTVQPCTQCGFFAVEPLCEICADTARQGGAICVVEQPTDILPLERTGSLRGTYHSLGGRLSPLDHVRPEDLRIGELLNRVREEKPPEVILALNADVEGEATANYLSDLLRESGVPVSRIAQGIPVGGGLEGADELTLTRALAGRIRV
ncbi:MAG TPA: recombination mediator RecR [Chthoniobacterales bacterium]